MKKFLSALLAVLILVSACAFAETASPEEPLEEGSILMRGYLDRTSLYYVSIPAEWAPIGIHSTQENIAQANEILGESEVQALLKELSPENNLLLCVSPTGEQLVITYGLSDGVTSDTLISQVDDFKKMLSAAYVGIEFKDDCGSYSINDYIQVLYIGAKYKGHAISQYFYPAGSNMYVFTFTDTESNIINAVLSQFRLVQEDDLN